MSQRPQIKGKPGGFQMSEAHKQRQSIQVGQQSKANQKVLHSSSALGAVTNTGGVFNRQTNSYEERTRHTKHWFVNQEAQMIEDQIKQQARRFRQEEGEEEESDRPAQMMTLAQQEESRIAKDNELATQQKNAAIADRIGIPQDAPVWFQRCHLDFYGGFAREWTRYEQHFEESGQTIPYWHSTALQTSTWDSPTLILSSLIMAGIDSDQNTLVHEWSPHVPRNSPSGESDWIRVRIKASGKSRRENKQRRYLYVNRMTQKVVQEDPFGVKQPATEQQATLPVKSLKQKNTKREVREDPVVRKAESDSDDGDADQRAADLEGIVIESGDNDEEKADSQENPEQQQETEHQEEVNEVEVAEQVEDDDDYGSEMLDPNNLSESDDQEAPVIQVGSKREREASLSSEEVAEPSSKRPCI